VLLVEAAEQTLYICSQTSPYPMELAAYRRYDDFLLNLGLIVSIAFYYVLLRGRRTWLLYAAVTGVLLSILGNLLYSLPTAREHFAVSAMNVFRVLTILPAILWIVSLLLQRAREKLVDARLLLAPVLLVYGNRIMGILILTTFQFGWQHRGEQTNFVLLSDPFRVNSEVLAKFLFLIAMLAILVNRFTRTRSQAERYATEFEAARNVQSLLIPATPGFLVESVYLPASEVGGDFFQILPGEDGSLLVVVGDVSGKGLKAAMTVSTIVGALRDQRMRQPAEI
jgi:sigma-B regulation protein RsbU (phosphoserine phosphatase)